MIIISEWLHNGLQLDCSDGMSWGSHAHAHAHCVWLLSLKWYCHYFVNRICVSAWQSISGEPTPSRWEAGGSMHARTSSVYVVLVSEPDSRCVEGVPRLTTVLRLNCASTVQLQWARDNINKHRKLSRLLYYHMTRKAFKKKSTVFVLIRAPS